VVKGLMAALVGFALGSIVVPAVAAAEPNGKSEEKRAAEFAEELLKAASMIHEQYFVEISRAELIDWAIGGLYGRLNRDIPASFEVRRRTVAGMKEEALRALLVEVGKDVQHSEELNSDRFLDLALEEMTRHLDSQTKVRYVPDVQFTVLWRAVGVGLKLQSDPTAGMLVVATAILGSPAYKAGIRAGDVLTEIALLEKANGEQLEEPKVIPSKGLSLAEALRLLKGKPGTRVRLTVHRPGVEEPVESTVTREQVAEESVLGWRRKEDDHWDHWIDRDKKLAYIRVTLFRNHTAKELEHLLRDLRKEDLKGLILDLRFNPGGSLNIATEVADLFIDDGLITTARSRGASLRRLSGKHEGSCLDFPMVCLVNEETARTSEIIAACLQDHQRAALMGERSAGQAGVQNGIRLNGDVVLEMTTAVFCRPSGKKLFRTYRPGADDEWGVIPEPKYVLRLPFAERQALAEHVERQTYIWPREQYGKEHGPAFKDRQLDMALSYLRTSAK
jgi:carboxyl-terminal processing protease